MRTIIAEGGIVFHACREKDDMPVCGNMLLKEQAAIHEDREVDCKKCLRTLRELEQWREVL